MAEFSVDTAALLTAAEQMSAFEQQVQESLARAQALVDSLGNGWRGEAAQAQRAAQAKWNEGAHDMCQALLRLRGVVEQAHANYSGAAAMNARMWT